MENCNECAPKYWDERNDIEKIEALRTYVVFLLDQVSRLHKLRRHTHSMSGKVVYEEEQFSLSRSYRLPCELQDKPKKRETK